MLAASKMTGLDLGGSSAASMASIASKNSDTDSKRSSTSSEEMLTTPKLLGPDTGKFFSKVKLSLVISTTFEFSRQKLDTKLLENGPSKFPNSKAMDFWQFLTGKTSVLAKFDKLKCQFSVKLYVILAGKFKCG